MQIFFPLQGQIRQHNQKERRGLYSPMQTPSVDTNARDNIASFSSSGCDETDNSTKPDAPWLISSVHLLTLHFLTCLNGAALMESIKLNCCVYMLHFFYRSAF